MFAIQNQMFFHDRGTDRDGYILVDFDYMRNHGRTATADVLCHTDFCTLNLGLASLTS